MKKRHWFGAILFAFAGLAYSQEGRIVKTEPNGVVIYNAAGVEAVKEQEKPVAMPEWKLTDLTISELEERLVHIDKKIANLGDDPQNVDRRKNYLLSRKETENRINQLKNPN